LFTFVLVYVDNLLITGDDTEAIAQLKHGLHTPFTIKDLSLARYFLGIEISRSPQGTLLNQRKYVLDILTDASLTGAKPVKFSLPKGLKLSKIQAVLCLILSHIGEWLVGYYTLLLLADISYVVQHLSQSLREPRYTNWSLSSYHAYPKAVERYSQSRFVLSCCQ